LSRGRKLVDGIGRGYISRREHLLVQLLLLHLVELVEEFVLVDGLSERVVGDGVDNLLAEGVLVPKFVPIACMSVKTIPA
jgi:hypothetical protein